MPRNQRSMEAQQSCRSFSLLKMITVGVHHDSETEDGYLLQSLLASKSDFGTFPILYKETDAEIPGLCFI